MSARLAVVSGGCSGIGLAVATRLLREGMRVAVADLVATEQIPGLSDSPGLVSMPPCDISCPEAVAEWLETLRQGQGAAQILVHCAGIYPANPFTDLDIERWQRIFSVNVEGFFLLARGLVPGMREAGFGRIVGVASNTFHDGTPGLTAYVASKGAMIGMVRSLGSELGTDGITVNAIAPSITDTPTTRSTIGLDGMAAFVERQAIPRLAVPEDYTGTVSFLVSEDSAFMTGQTLIVDGGWTHA